jgi:hypothetical protein
MASRLKELSGHLFFFSTFLIINVDQFGPFISQIARKQCNLRELGTAAILPEL